MAAELKHVHADNIATMYTSTSVAMIFTALTGVVTVLFDGILTSRFLGADIYSGIALLRPFTSVVLMLASFLSTGCSFVCSHRIGAGEKDEANRAFNLSVFLGLGLSALLILFSFVFPDTLLKLCGVSLTKLPELHPHMYAYLRGYTLGLPAIILAQIFSPILVMDNGKKLFSISSALLCVVNILGDILNALVLHGGAFGMGLSSSCAYMVQLLILLLHFTRKGSFFRISPKLFRLDSFREIVRGGAPSFVKRLGSTLRDIFINHLNLTVALSTAAIAARGIQGDLFQPLFCISTGLGRTLVTMSGMYYGTGDRQGLKRLYSYAMKFGIQLTGAVSLAVFVFAGPLARIYTDDPEVIALTVFSVRWMAAGLILDTVFCLIQHYLQGIGNMKLLNVMTLCERFAVPVVTAWVFGMLYGSKGILASVAITKFILVLILLIYVCIRCRGLPKSWDDVMFLPEDFGGSEADNLYAEIRTVEDVVRESERAYAFCLEHGADRRKAYWLSLCVEEMAINILDHAREHDHKSVCADFRLYVSDGRICFSLRDLSCQFDPTAFYTLHLADSPEAHIGIRMVTNLAKEIRYFSAFNSNNLILYID